MFNLGHFCTKGINVCVSKATDSITELEGNSALFPSGYASISVISVISMINLVDFPNSPVALRPNLCATRSHSLTLNVPFARTEYHFSVKHPACGIAYPLRLYHPTLLQPLRELTIPLYCSNYHLLRVRVLY